MTDEMANVDVATLAAAVRAGDRAEVARAITLVESRRPDHRSKAIELLDQLERGGPSASVRIGISGLPGAGKSTMIERLGLDLIDEGHRVAVLAIDPSSTRTGGSILGDKTRMTELSRSDSAFVRPSPTSGTLGGVALRTRDAISVCEAAGFDRILIETVGVGQSETVVEQLVDAVLLVVIPGAGDELQGIKRGILEIADVIAVNQSDRDPDRARAHAAELQGALRYSSHPRRAEGPRVLPTSAKSGDGIESVRAALDEAVADDRSGGVFETRRVRQKQIALHALIEEERVRLYAAWPGRDDAEAEAADAVRAGRPPATAAFEVVQRWARALAEKHGSSGDEESESTA